MRQTSSLTVPVNSVTQVYSCCSQGHCDNKKCQYMAERSGTVSWVEIALRLGNNLLEDKILGYYFGEVIRNSKIEIVIQYCVNYEDSGRTIKLNFNVAT